MEGSGATHARGVPLKSLEMMKCLIWMKEWVVGSRDVKIKGEIAQGDPAVNA